MANYGCYHDSYCTHPFTVANSVSESVFPG